MNDPAAVRPTSPLPTTARAGVILALTLACGVPAKAQSCGLKNHFRIVTSMAGAPSGELRVDSRIVDNYRTMTEDPEEIRWDTLVSDDRSFAMVSLLDEGSFRSLCRIFGIHLGDATPSLFAEYPRGATSSRAEIDRIVAQSKRVEHQMQGGDDGH